MNSRIKELRKALGLTQNDFGVRLGLAPNTITNYETGRREPSNQIIIAICREFNVNEEWLRTGEGEMFQDLSQGELAARVVGEALADDNKFIQSVFISLGKLTPTEWKVVEKFITSIEEEMKKK